MSDPRATRPRPGPACALGLACTLLALAGSARAATLAISPDRGTYTVGETVTLSVLLDLEGVATSVFDGRIVFDPALVTGLDVTTSLDGDVGIPPFPDCGTGFCDVFDHVLSVPVTGLVTATVTLAADATGLVEIDWDPAPLGLVGAPGTAFTVIPEPRTAALVALGIATIGLAARRRTGARRARQAR